MDKKSGLKLNIGIIHPDLGIGGAERLIVDAAVELASHGHNVHIFTAHHDKNRCFEETLAGTFPVTVYGSFLPRHVFQHFHALCAYLRCIFVAICMLFMWTSFDVVLVDQVSVVIPLMKLKKSSKVVFYCHFPDLLLAQHGTSLRRVYRKPIDFVEEVTTGMADLILVNSKFTATTFAKTFKRLDSQAVRPAVLYPAVNVEQFTTPDAFKLNFLSINRFERKKNIELAISAFSMLCKDETNVLQGHNLANATLTVAGKSPDILQPETRHHVSEHMNEVMPRGLFNIIAFFDCSQYKSTCWPNVFVFKLMDNYFHSLTRTPNGVSVSGGFDRRLRENVEYLEELKVLAEREGVSPRVRFITSCSTSERNTLLSQCLCVLYTPKDEHFGIVPLEAMAAHKPVMSCNSGGPVETIKDGVTGFLCEPNPEAFSSAMSKFIREPQLAESMGKEARRHVEESFSTKIFGQNLNRYLVDMVREKND